jgi:tRNA pseudouridine55 synthase
MQGIDEGYIVNINKPETWSSYDVVRKIKKITSCRKVGHAGTLDPFATGVLLVCLNKATKLTKELIELPKEYIAVVELGKETDTQDLTGNIIEEKEVPELNQEKISNTLNSFLGEIEQSIPIYSAKRINGQRYYKLARQGKRVPTSSKIVQIYELEIISFGSNLLEFRVACGKGTYIRMLGYDIANKLGTTGHLKKLMRTKIGNYRIEDALTIPQFQATWKTQLTNENISQH